MLDRVNGRFNGKLKKIGAQTKQTHSKRGRGSFLRMFITSLWGNFRCIWESEDIILNISNTLLVSVCKSTSVYRSVYLQIFFLCVCVVFETVRAVKLATCSGTWKREGFMGL